MEGDLQVSDSFFWLGFTVPGLLVTLLESKQFDDCGSTSLLVLVQGLTR